MADAVLSVLERSGPALQQRLEGTSPAAVANAYERQMCLERREPLQDSGESSVGVPIDAPPYSQAMNAAVLTLAAHGLLSADWVLGRWLQGLSSGPLTAEARDWLFYVTLRPPIDRDRMDRRTTN
ncbi:hypothetical protein DL765_011468 [Monosporascus sp. GIB2]|nr:hypothetical protein DL765_011468 [Monosporascus sp. GIB2]